MIGPRVWGRTGASAGINVARDGSGDPAALRVLGARWLRVVAHPDYDLGPWLRACKAQGLKILMVLARESQGPMLWPAAVLLWKIQYGRLVDAWQVCNEPDAGWTPDDPQSGAQRAASGIYPSSWCMDPADVTRHTHEARQVLGDLAVIIGPGLSSGHPVWAHGVDWSACNGIAMHPYAKEPGTAPLNDLIDGYRAINPNLWVTEYDSRTLGMHAALFDDERLNVAMAFCHDGRTMVPEFGMIDANGRLTPSYTAFIQAAGPPVPKPDKEEIMPYVVGPGILQAMAADGTEPATDGEFWPAGTAQLERCYAMNGTLYTYLFATGQVIAHRPSDAPTPEPSWVPLDRRGKFPVRAGVAPYPWRDILAVDAVDLHYTAGPLWGTADDVATYQTGGQSHLPFPEIAYHLYVNGAGEVTYCQDLGKRVWGSDGPGRNERAVHICYAGNTTPNAAQRDGIKRAIGWVQEQLGRTVTVHGHKDFSATQCPGADWPQWKAAVLP